MIDKQMWNDGSPLLDFMGREGAPPVASRHLCFGGGGGGGTPQAPDYSGYIAEMSKIGARGQERSTELYDWAKNQGQAIQTTANAVGQRAGVLSDATMGTDPRLEAQWEKTYMPLYEAQAQDAQRMIGELPRTEEQYAGKFSADTAQGFDAAKAQHNRQLQSYGLKAPSVGSEALDMTAANQRAAAQVAASEQGRMTARTEARNVTQNAVQSGLALPQVGAQQAGIGLAAGNQQVNAPESAISTTAGAYSPSLGYYSAALPYMKTWGDTMMKSYDQQLAASKQADESGGGMGSLLGTGLGIAGSIAGSYFGPMGSMVGGKLGSMAGSAAGGSGKMFSEGGEVGAGPETTEGHQGDPHYVSTTLSPSGGAITDDVPARLNAGEFVIPKDVVSWMGEEKLHKLIMGTRQKQQTTIAQSGVEPEMGPPEQQDQTMASGGGVLHTMPPRFVSEGARR